MKTIIFLFLCFFIMACDNSETNYSVKQLNVNLTGNTSVDTSIPFMTLDELQQMEIIDGVKEVDSDKLNKIIPSPSYDPSSGSLTIYGPLHDNRVVRGKNTVVNFVKYGEYITGKVFVNYGFYSPYSLVNKKEITSTGYGNLVGYIDVPSDATGFYCNIETEDGTIFNNKGTPYSAKVYDSIISMQIADGKLTLNYSGAVLNDNTYVHYGFNNWVDLNEIKLQKGWQISKYAQSGDYGYVYIDLPYWVEYIDFVFRSGENWDNNSGKDWHYSVHPFVDVRVSEINGANQRAVSVYYANGKLNPVIAHLGFDNWTNVIEENMYYTSGGQWSLHTMNIPADALELNAVFKDPYNNWDNNFDKNWNFNLK